MAEIIREEMDLISVIVPVYNVEKYLPTCIESILRQTYTNLEVVLVDDGSTDNSSSICDRYAQIDGRVKVIHKTNGGLSDARNVGIEIATGEYITFIDSDDYVGRTFVERLYFSAKDANAQISICDYLDVAESENAEIAENQYQTFVMKNVECLKQTYQPTMHGMEFTACAKLFHRSLFAENGIQYPVGKIHEDTFTTYKLLYYAQRVVFIDIKLYYYRERGDSIMHTKFSVKNLVKIEATKEACDFFYGRNERALFLIAYNLHLKTYCQVVFDLQRSSDTVLKNNYLKKIVGQFRQDIKSRDLISLGFLKMVYYCVVARYPYPILLKALL